MRKNKYHWWWCIKEQRAGWWVFNYLVSPAVWRQSCFSWLKLVHSKWVKDLPFSHEQCPGYSWIFVKTSLKNDPLVGKVSTFIFIFNLLFFIPLLKVRFCPRKYINTFVLVCVSWLLLCWNLPTWRTSENLYNWKHGGGNHWLCFSLASDFLGMKVIQISI